MARPPLPPGEKRIPRLFKLRPPVDARLSELAAAHAGNRTAALEAAVMAAPPPAPPRRPRRRPPP